MQLQATMNLSAVLLPGAALATMANNSMQHSQTMAPVTTTVRRGMYMTNGNVASDPATAIALVKKYVA